MGKELSLARSEKERRPMLLVITGSGEIITTACHRNKRTKKSYPSKISKGRETKDTKTKSQVSSEVERTNASSSETKRRRRDYSDRKSDRGDEGKNKSVRRSAQELGIKLPPMYCEEQLLKPHYWVRVDAFSSGSLFQCKYCYDYLWLPLSYEGAERLCRLIRKYGKDEGYCHYLNKYRVAKILMAKLQDLRRLSVDVADKREFARLVDKVLSDREYDRKEVSNG